VVRAEGFGVPQARHRIFIVGLRSDLKVRPRPSAAAQGSYRVRQTIGDLPAVRSGLSKAEDSPSRWYSSSEKAEIILIGPIILSVAWEFLVAWIRTERAGPAPGAGVDR
jgi:site-specific DNA-cytosine methylase